MQLVLLALALANLLLAALIGRRLTRKVRLLETTVCIQSAQISALQCRPHLVVDADGYASGVATSDGTYVAFKVGTANPALTEGD